MRKWLAAIAVLVVILLVAGSVYWFGFRVAEPAIELTDAQRAHLQAEANRLVAVRDAIEQPDAAWIAQRLPDNPTAEDLARLGEQRLQSLKDNRVARIESEFPELWDAWNIRARNATGSNGTDALFEAGRLVQPLIYDDRFRKLLDDGATVSAQIRGAFIAETDAAAALVKDAAASDTLVWAAPRQERILDNTPMPDGYYVFRTLPTRVRLLAESGQVDQAVAEMDVLMNVSSRVDWNLSVIGVLVHCIAGERLLVDAALPLIERHGVSAENARAWLKLAGASRRDLAYAMAVDSVAHARMLQHEPEITFARVLRPDLDVPNVKTAFTVEEIFESWRRHSDWCFEFYPYVTGPRASLLTPQGQRDLATAMRTAPFLHLSNYRDDVTDRLRWAALDLRIVEREHGPLSQHPEIVEQVLRRWPGLMPAWDGDTLKVSVRKEYMFGQEPSVPLFELSALD
jgi:hypothetical protein